MGGSGDFDSASLGRGVVVLLVLFWKGWGRKEGLRACAFGLESGLEVSSCCWRDSAVLDGTVLPLSVGLVVAEGDGAAVDGSGF